METMLADCFVVFVREYDPLGGPAEEWELARCHTHEEALRVMRDHHQPGCQCIVRYEGPSGGGD
jgi:hypothetical protein